MSLIEFYIFYLILTIRTICGDNFLTNFGDVYCEQYCGNECKNDNASRSVKACTKANNTIITNNYELKLVGEDLKLIWYTSNPDLHSLMRLDANHVSLQELTVINNHDEEGRTIAPCIPYLQAFGIKSLKWYSVRALGFSIHEHDIDITLGAKSARIYVTNSSLDNNLFIHNYLRQSKTNLESVLIECGANASRRNIVSRFLFDVNKTNLTKLEIRKCNIVKVPDRIDSLNDFSPLDGLSDVPEDITIFGSHSLRNSLQEITLTVGRRINLNDFKEFVKLKFIGLNVQNHNTRIIPCRKLQAFVCVWLNKNVTLLSSPTHCKFTLGINNRRCPQSCNCSLDYDTKSFFINCTDQGLMKVPKLPIPITGHPKLLFKGNKLSKLPNLSYPGFAKLAELHLPNNCLTNLTADQLPPELTLLDIRNNFIQTLDEKVASFLLDRIHQTKLLQAGILWISQCGNTKLINYLDELKTNNEPVYHHHLSGPCPDYCTCCFNATSKQFVIDCRSKGLINFPILPFSPIKGSATLLLDDNQLEVLPQHSLRNSTLQELRMKNNILTSLTINQLPPNIAYLDIRNNSLSELDDEVTQFLSVRMHNLTGNPWECSCKFTKFLTFLKNNHSEEYKAALRRCSGQEYCPPSCFCCSEYDTGKFKINCSSQGLTKIPVIPITNYSVLLFENNLLTNLSNNSPQGFDQLKELHLANNHIWQIEKIPSNLTLLDLGKNKLQRLSAGMINLLTNQSQLILSISGNPWICSCEEIHFLQFTKQFKGHISDFREAKCNDFTLLVDTAEKDLCPRIPAYVFIIIAFIGLFVIIAIIGLTVAWKYVPYFRESIKMWLYDKNLCLGQTVRREMKKEKIFDAFLAYTHKDAEFVDEYIEVLENGLHKFRLCYYERDWQLGLSIPACICQSVEDSKRIIILLTKNFVKSPWGRLEFRVALQATSEDKYKRLIIVVYPDVENFDDLDSELKLYMTFNKYLCRNDPNFWSKLIYAMPHKRC